MSYEEIAIKEIIGHILSIPDIEEFIVESIADGVGGLKFQENEINIEKVVDGVINELSNELKKLKKEIVKNAKSSLRVWYWREKNAK